MLKLLPRFFAVTLAASILPAHAERDSSPINPEQFLKEVDQLEVKQKDRLRAGRAEMIATLQNAAQSSSTAARLYEDAIEVTQFNGRKEKTQAFSDWKKKNGDLLRSQEMGNALQLHLRYLILSLQRGASEKESEFVAPTLSYINDLSKTLLDQAKGAALPAETKALLERPLTDSVFTKWMLLGPWLPKANDWELNPSNIDGIFEKNIRQSLREEKSPRLIETWDLQMKIQADRITQGRLDYEADKFNNITQPRMVFSRANDMILIGLKNKGCTEILQLLRSRPEHPDFSQWAAKIRDTLSSRPAAESPSPTPEPTPAATE